MLIHWHVAGEGDAAAGLREWLAACLDERCRSGSPPQAVLSWGAPDRTLTYRTLGREEESSCATWPELAGQVRADLTVGMRPGKSGGGTLALTRGRTLPARVHGSWQWAPGESPGEPGRRVFYPRLPLAWPRPEARELGRVTLAVSLAEPASIAAAYRLAAALRREFPDRPLGIISDSLLQGAGGVGWARPPGEHLAAGETLILCSGRIAWAPVALEALARGQRVIAPQAAAYAGYLADERGVVWDPTGAGEDVVAHLRLARQDPEETTRRTRRAAAWARRWSTARMAHDLEGWVLELATALPAPARERREQWVLRREIGIGDIVFALCSAAGLKARDPDCRITFHTAPEHTEWVRWFPCVDAVTSGAFAPPPGARVGDLERYFPSTAHLDRALAMGQVVGIEASWPPPPQLPARAQRGGAARLPRPRRPRIAFAPASKGRHATRSLSQETALQLARQLTELGEVVWLDAQALDTAVPAGVTDLSGQLTPAEVLAVLARCATCVSVDSGLLYLAASTGKPVVGLFTHIGALQRLWLAPQFIALQPALPCAPCGEGPEALHCQRGQPLNGTPLPCVQSPWSAHLPAAVGRILEGTPEAAGSESRRPIREVWNIPPFGERLVWAVDELPAPWPLAKVAG